SLRAIHTRLTRADSRARLTDTAPNHSDGPHAPAPTTGGGTTTHNLDDVLALLDQVAADADTLNAYINTLLTQNT
ncbi:MAG TPA: hypothetical protein VGM75_04915, partial [Pseudonocardiaceae bacterium]